MLRAVTRGYVGFFRGTPLFVQILLVHFALMPALIQPTAPAAQRRRGSRVPTNHGPSSPAHWRSRSMRCILSEILRAGIQSIHGGQTQAAYSIGLTHAQAMRYVVLPQACATWFRRWSTKRSRCEGLFLSPPSAWAS